MDLSFQSLYLPPSGEKAKLLILSSGIHGIEGYTGSALQSHFLKTKRSSGYGVLILHGINAHGMKHFRRVTENNVDLNRNFDVSDELFRMKNPEYEKLYSFLNTSCSRFLFYPKAIGLILKHGMENLRRAILRGQYEFPEGIFFGGKTFEPQVNLVLDLVTEVARGYEEILLIDLHTGYGEKGKLHLFGDRSPFIDPDYMKTVFGNLPVDFGQEKDFYAVTGGFTVFLAKLFHGKAKFAGVVFEFGTIDSQKISGSLESLYRMVSEKRCPEDFRELFYPSDPEWRTMVVAQFERALRSLKLV